MKFFNKYMYLFEHPYLHDTVIAAMMLLCVMGMTGLSIVICYMQCQQNIENAAIDKVINEN